MNKADMFESRWRWRQLLICNLIALAILASWLWPPARQIWDRLDLAAFHVLNAPLASHQWWAYLGAVGNMRYADLASALVAVFALMKRGWILDSARVRSAFYGFFALVLLLFLIRIGPVRELLKIFDWERISPSRVIDGAVRLTQMFPGWDERWHLKDSSNSCFPGDHAAVLMLWALFLWPVASAGNRLLIAVLAVIFMTPRLVSGAHWLTDDLVGGIALSLVAIGFGRYTPYAARVVPWLQRIGDPILGLIGRVPGLGGLRLILGR